MLVPDQTTTRASLMDLGSSMRLVFSQEGWYKDGQDTILIMHHAAHDVWSAQVWYNQDPRLELKRALQMKEHGYARKPTAQRETYQSPERTR